MLRHATLLVLSAILFLHGFFPIPNTTDKFPNDPPNHIGNISVKSDEFYKPHFNKTVLIIIDGLRWDFATSKFMPHTIDYVNRKGCISKVCVESPTVTLPRIKALTTGSIPQYIDVVKNLASSEILKDSWLHSAKAKGLNTIFYGDNTWEKLFPNFFHRSEGTTSFFVWDFTEVDDNVTRNVHLELQRADWDIMILHYLGLDHIGHVLGPFSPKILTKLNEMDEIVKEIHEKTSYTDTLILVTGDHGMRDRGGHGGTSYPEITVPLMAIGHNCQNASFLQTDIPANLAILLGLNIPTSSIGTIQKGFLDNLNIQEYLFALRYNTEILMKKDKLCQDTFDQATHFHEMYLKQNDSSYAALALELYQECSSTINRELYDTSSKQDISALLLVLLVLFNLLIILVIDFLQECQSLHIVEFGFCCSILLMRFFIVFDALFNFLRLLLVVLMYIKVTALIVPFKSVILRHYENVDIFLLATSILHPITFISTSFIEEEHYFWIFFSVTLFLLIFTNIVNHSKSMFTLAGTKLIAVLVCLRFSMDLNSTIENSVQNDDNWANFLTAEKNHVYYQIFFAAGLLVVFLTLCLDQKVKENIVLRLLNLTCLILIFILKSAPYHNTFLGKLIWALILLQKVFFNQFSWKQCWVLSTTLLIKPHNIILIPLAVFVGNLVSKLNKAEKPQKLAAVHYILSNCFYFLQGHRNSLASVDISIGYTGLNDYYPLLVISQVLIHTYTFPVLFHFTFLEHVSENTKQHTFWKTLLALRTSVFLFTCVVMMIFKEHLFIWSVFAPKLFIESIHAGFLFIEISFWNVSEYFKKLCNKICNKW